MREHLFELSVMELKDLYMHETKAMVFALEAGVPWEDLQYVRDSINDITRFIDLRSPPSKLTFRKRNGEIPPPFIHPAQIPAAIGIAKSLQQSAR